MPHMLLEGIEDIQQECDVPVNYIDLINQKFNNAIDIKQIEDDQTLTMSSSLDAYINL